MLSSLRPYQPLIIYVSASHTAVSRALVHEKETTKEDKKISHQIHIYFVSKALAGFKKYYSEMEKIFYVVVMSTRKLHHYFKAHKVRVLTNQPLNDIFGNWDSYGRIGKWAMELSEHIIDFKKKEMSSSHKFWQVSSQIGWSPSVTPKTQSQTCYGRCITIEPRAIQEQGLQQS
jgi:hypothetical protein